MSDHPYSVRVTYLPDVNTSPDRVDFNSYTAATKFFCMMAGDETVATVSIYNGELEVGRWVNLDELEPWETGEFHPVTGHPIPCSCTDCGR